MVKACAVALSLALALLAAAPVPCGGADFAGFVNPWIGTSGTGHTTVAASYPLGMVQAGPDTGTESWDYASGYRDSDRELYGFSHSHLSGTGVPELGDLLLLPFAGDAPPEPRAKIPFDKASEAASPGRYGVVLDGGVRCEVAVSQRAAVWRFTYPKGAAARLLVDMQWGLVWEKMDEHVLAGDWSRYGERGLAGWAETKSWTKRRWNFALEADRGFRVVGGGRRFALDFGTTEAVTVRVALSTTTEEGAKRNLCEVRGKTLEEVAAAARDAWNGYLSRVEVPGADEATATNVYTALYHLFWQPNDITDVDGAYRGADGKVAKVSSGHRYFSTLSLWDTYRAAHPLYTILAPELVDDFVRTMVLHQKAVGYLPVWPLMGRDTHCMVANHSIPVLVEAVGKNLTTLSAEEVYSAIRATLRESHEGKPKENWAVLDKYGWYPCDLVPEEGVSITMEGAYDDWCAARLARRLGKDEDAAFFEKRAEAWKNVFDPETKTVRGRSSDGRWRTPFDPSALFDYGVPRDISEASANQYVWHVQQDLPALEEMLGGRFAALAKLEEHFDHSRAPHGEMLDVTGLIGEYAHGNEPGHHVPYLFSLWGRPERTAEIVREVFDRFYLLKADGLCGNDDCGQMSAWYLLSAMGFYPVEPTGGKFVLGAPQMPRVTIKLKRRVGEGTNEFHSPTQNSNSNDFTTVAKNLSKENKYVKSVTLNGKRVDGLNLNYSDMMNGGELVFEMSDKPFDVVVVGGTSAGIASAVQATRMGARTVVLEATGRIGGMTTGGLGQTDIGDTSAFGGLARKFYSDIKRHYDDNANWKWQRREDYRPNGQTAGSSDGETMWTFEPSAALAVLESWERKEGIRVERGAVLDRRGVEVDGGRIVSVRTCDGRVWRGSVFVDATYEGDLMAAAGVSCRIGREANSEYGETLNGLQRARAEKHQIQQGVSAYRVPGNPGSGLLPGIEPHDDERPDGAGDDRVQAYCYRLCLTDAPENRIPFAKPDGYDEADYELLLRNIERTPEDTVEHWRHQPWNNSPMPNRKTDTNNRTGVSMDFIGGSWRWSEADYAERGRIAAEHEKWQRGALWTLANHPRVPEYVRNEVAKWGLCRDEFTENGGWPTQLYVREARRMVGEYVMTEANCRGKRVAARPIAFAAYTMDSHHVRRYVDEGGFVRNEGDVQDKAGVKGPYPIDYGAIVPKRGECANLLVPVCLSATHIAYGSIRMEPVFFATGQAAGAAAALAAGSKCAVQDVAYGALSDALGAMSVAKVKSNVVALLTERRAWPPELREGVASCGADTGDSTAKAVMESVCPPSADDVAKYVATQCADGRWPDIDYETVTRSAWPVCRHLQRMKAIACAPRTPGSAAAFRRALSAWLRGGFRNSNWWWNQIGVPLELGAACLAMDGEISPSERAAVVERMRESKIGLTGQNRIWLAECVLYRALLEGNAADVKAARDAIFGEVETSGGVEGIQRDWSFHQHGNQPQLGNYGLSYILTVPRLADCFEGTPLAFPAERRDVLRSLVQKGFAPAVWNGAMDVAAIGRQLGKGASRVKGAGVVVAAERLGIDVRSVPQGLHWFPTSAYGVYRSGGWMASVKCHTATIQGTERVNEDNLLGAHLADGALFVYSTGDEYRDIFPLWNWRHIPGITSYDVDTVDWKERNKAEDAVRDGDSIRFVLDRAGLRATTEWRFSPDGVEVHVTGISSGSELPVVTTVEQSLAQPNAKWWREGGGIVAVNGAFRYELPSNAIVRIESRTGSWRRHMGAMAEKKAEGNVFEVTVPHGVATEGSSCSWRVSCLVRQTHGVVPWDGRDRPL